MKNPEIELVKKFLDNPESVSQEELNSAAARADDDLDAARTEIDYAVAVAVARAVSAVRAAARAGDVSGASDVDRAARVARRWVKEYEELTR